MNSKKMCSAAKSTLVISAIAFSALNVQAALYERRNGMIYDSTLNITWLQDANYAKTSGLHHNGLMTWDEANVFGSFTLHTRHELHEWHWRLPSAGLIGNDEMSNDGSTDRGTNNSRSELGHLFLELGNTSSTGWLNKTFVDPSTGKQLSFLNVPNYPWQSFWEAELVNPDLPYEAWIFTTGYGLQSSMNVTSMNYAWFVTDGDVDPWYGYVPPAPVPVPAAVWLMGSSLIGLAGIARRKK